jgi:hypothetical protein
VAARRGDRPGFGLAGGHLALVGLLAGLLGFGLVCLLGSPLALGRRFGIVLVRLFFSFRA